MSSAAATGFGVACLAALVLAAILKAPISDSDPAVVVEEPAPPLDARPGGADPVGLALLTADSGPRARLIAATLAPGDIPALLAEGLRGAPRPRALLPPPGAVEGLSEPPAAARTPPEAASAPPESVAAPRVGPPTPAVAVAVADAEGIPPPARKPPPPRGWERTKAAAANAPAQKGGASWYALRSRTANGEMMDPDAVTAAHRTLPFGTLVRVENLRNGRSMIVRINDRGPYVRGRVIDVSRAVAAHLGFQRTGVTRVRVTRLDGGAIAEVSSPPSQRRTGASPSAGRIGWAAGNAGADG